MKSPFETITQETKTNVQAKNRTKQTNKPKNPRTLRSSVAFRITVFNSHKCGTLACVTLAWFANVRLHRRPKTFDSCDRRGGWYFSNTQIWGHFSSNLSNGTQTFIEDVTYHTSSMTVTSSQGSTAGSRGLLVVTLRWLSNKQHRRVSDVSKMQANARRAFDRRRLLLLTRCGARSKHCCPPPAILYSCSDWHEMNGTRHDRVLTGFWQGSGPSSEWCRQQHPGWLWPP